MSRIVRSLIVVLVGVIAASLIGCPDSGNEGGKTAVDTGSHPPASQPEAAPVAQAELPPGWVGEAMDFTCTTFDGETVRAGGLGKPLVLNFWASW